jgi:hypothetical protein
VDWSKRKNTPSVMARWDWRVTKFRLFGSELGTLPKQACQALPRIRPVHQAFRAFPTRDD